MKRKILLFIIVSLFHCFIAGSPVFASERINDFRSEIIINTDGTINVTEIITYYFDIARHGIYRDIPTVKTNKEDKKFQMDFQVLGVTDESDIAYKYQLSKEGTNLRIKIGDPDRTITGSHIYKISYKVTGALTYFSDHDELYWNVTGNNWQVSIDNSSAVVTLPQKASSNIKTICYTGKTGSMQQFCKAEPLSVNSYRITATQSFSPYEGLTLAVSFPKGIVQVLEPKEYGKKTLFDMLLGILIIIGLLLWYVVAPFYIIYLWFKYGRDPEVGKPVTAWYDPPKDKTGRSLTPGEVGTLVDEKVDNRDLTGTIVSLAIRGYLKIKEEKKTSSLFGSKEYTFIKIKDYCSSESGVAPDESRTNIATSRLANARSKSNELQNHEILILDKFFPSRDEISTSDLKDNFYHTVDKFKKDLYQKVVDLGFFPENPNSVRTKYIIFGVLAIFTGNIILAVLLFILGQAMPRKTIEGAKAKIVAWGLKNFLVSQERQLEFQVKNWFMFEKLLPYAIIFGVEKIWAERFKDLEVTPPDWYEGEYGQTFNTIYFTSALANSMTSMNSMMMSPTSSSSGFSSGFGGGGSSGGGGGGGGGGSW